MNAVGQDSGDARRVLLDLIRQVVVVKTGHLVVVLGVPLVRVNWNGTGQAKARSGSVL